jgi:hypothetical protein
MYLQCSTLQYACDGRNSVVAATLCLCLKQHSHFRYCFTTIYAYSIIKAAAVTPQMIVRLLTLIVHCYLWMLLNAYTHTRLVVKCSLYHVSMVC